MLFAHKSTQSKNSETEKTAKPIAGKIKVLQHQCKTNVL
jgi:hypothetical protein